jgi:hypothetical protein
MHAVVRPSWHDLIASNMSLDDMSTRHAFDRDVPLQAYAHQRRRGAFLFPAVFHKLRGVGGDVCAAGIMPVLKKSTGELMVLLPEEDMNIAGDFSSKRIWSPALGVLGGKVDAKDSHWLATVARELNEESAGLLSASAIAHVATFDARKEGWPDEGLSAFTAYLPDSKYQVLFYPVVDAVKDEWVTLPQRYEAAFSGAMSGDLQRSATKMHWVSVNRVVSGSSEACSAYPGAAASLSSWEPPSQPPPSIAAAESVKAIMLSHVLHECVNKDPDACARRCDALKCNGRDQPLPLKRELKSALAQSAIAMELLAAVAKTSRSPSPAPALGVTVQDVRPTLFSDARQAPR